MKDQKFVHSKDRKKEKRKKEKKKERKKRSWLNNWHKVSFSFPTLDHFVKINSLSNYNQLLPWEKGSSHQACIFLGQYLKKKNKMS